MRPQLKLIACLAALAATCCATGCGKKGQRVSGFVIAAASGDPSLQAEVESGARDLVVYHYNGSPLYVDKTNGLEEPFVVGAYASDKLGQWMVHVTLGKASAGEFEEFTRTLVENGSIPGKFSTMAIIYDGEVIAAPMALTPIPGGELAFTGDFSKDRAEYFAEQLQPK